MARSKFAYKLLSQDMKSYDNTKWKLNEIKEKSDKSKIGMCSSDVFHCYAHPILAILFNPIHADIENPRLFKIKIDGICNEDATKQASHSQMLYRELPIPEITLNQKIAFGIYCALTTCKKEGFITWANNWISGVDRSNNAANAASDYAAYSAAAYSADAAYSAAAYSAAYAANAAAYAAYSAAHEAAAHEAAVAAAYAAEFNNKKLTTKQLLRIWNKAKHIK